MNPINIPNKLIRAALECAAKQDIRTHLNGVTVEILPSGKAVVMGTDGHMMFAGWADVFDSEGQAPDQKAMPIKFVAPRQHLDAAIKANKGADLEVHDLNGDKLVWGGMSFGRLEEHKPWRFEWRDAIPLSTSEQAPKDAAPQFNPTLLIRGQRALGHVVGRATPKAASSIIPVLRYGKTANDAAVMLTDMVSGDPAIDALVVVMPMRVNCPGQPAVPTK